MGFGSGILGAAARAIVPAVIAGVGPAHLPSLAAAQTRAAPLFSSQTELVVLHVSVKDGDDRFVSGLTADDFAIYESGEPQEIQLFSAEETPVTVGLVIDNSTSMRTKRDRVVAAALAFGRSSTPDDSLFIVNFTERVRLGLPETVAFTSEMPVLRQALDGVRSLGRTALYDAVDFALDHVRTGRPPKKVLIVVSDGADNASRRTFDDILRKAREHETVIYTIGLYDQYDDADPEVLEELAESTGGETFVPRRISDVVSILERIARDIRETYTLGYVPSNPERDGTFRRIRVVVESPHGGRLKVRARSGYQMPAGDPSDAS